LLQGNSTAIPASLLTNFAGGVVAFVPSDDYMDVELKLASLSILEWARVRL
jgi:hypothetical protein